MDESKRYRRENKIIEDFRAYDEVPLFFKEAGEKALEYACLIFDEGYPKYSEAELLVFLSSYEAAKPLLEKVKNNSELKTAIAYFEDDYFTAFKNGRFSTKTYEQSEFLRTYLAEKAIKNL